jgi:hypothetical protein
MAGIFGTSEFQGPAAVNFYGMLSGLGDTLQANAKIQREQALRDAFKDGLPKAADGSIDFGATGDILSQHGADLGTVLTVAKLHQEQLNRQLQLQASGNLRTTLGNIFPGGTPPVASPAGSPQSPLVPGQSPPIAPVQPSAKVWGDKEAEDAGLYDSPPQRASYGDSLAGKRPPSPLSQPQAQPPAAPSQPVQTAQPLQPAQQPQPTASGFQGIGVQHIPALAGAMVNPYLPSGDRDLAGKLLTRALDDAKEPDKIRTLTALKEQSNYPGTILQLEMDMRKAGKPGVTVDQRVESAQSQSIGKALGDVQGEDIKAGSHAISKMRQLATLDNANQSGGDDISSGPLGKAILTGKQGLSEVLGIDTKGLPESEVIQKVGFGLATNMIKAISNRPSQMEFMKALENVPGLFMSKQGRVAMTSITLQEARAEQGIGRLAARHKDVEGGPVWQEVKDKYYDDHPLISPFTGSPFSPQDVQMIINTSSQAPPPTAPSQPPQGGNVSRQGVPWSVQ